MNRSIACDEWCSINRDMPNRRARSAAKFPGDGCLGVRESKNPRGQRTDDSLCAAPRAPVQPGEARTDADVDGRPVETPHEIACSDLESRGSDDAIVSQRSRSAGNETG